MARAASRRSGWGSERATHAPLGAHQGLASTPDDDDEVDMLMFLQTGVAPRSQLKVSKLESTWSLGRATDNEPGHPPPAEPSFLSEVEFIGLRLNSLPSESLWMKGDPAAGSQQLSNRGIAHCMRLHSDRSLELF